MKLTDDPRQLIIPVPLDFRSWDEPGLAEIDWPWPPRCAKGRLFCERPSRAEVASQVLRQYDLAVGREIGLLPMSQVST